jgi:CRP-like cAMP-binding protein
MISPETLRRFPLFARQDADMLKQIAMLADEISADPGHPLFFEGEVAKKLFLISEGAVVLTINMGEKGEQNLKELEPLSVGEVVGWSAIIKPHIYKMGAKVDRESRLITFDGEGLRDLFDKNPVFGYYFMQKIAEVVGERLISKCVQLMSLVV